MGDRCDDSHVLGEETEATSLLFSHFSPRILRCPGGGHRYIFFPALVSVDSYIPPWLSFRVVTTRVSHLRELMKIYLNSMPFKLFFKKQFSTVDLETNRSILASIISD